MFGGKGPSNIAKILSDLNRDDAKLIASLEKLHEFLKRFKKFGDLELDDVKKRGIFGGDDKFNKVIESLDVNIDYSIAQVDSLIKNLKDERKEIQKYYSKLSHSTMESLRELESRLISYNRDQYHIMEDINQRLPGVVEGLEGAVGMEDETIEDFAGRYIHLYSNLEDAIQRGAQKDHLYNHLIMVLRHLNTFVGGWESLFKDKINNFGNPEIFARNYFNLTSQAAKKIDNIIKKTENFEEFKDTYDEMGDKQEDFDKYMKGLLEKLYTGIEKLDDKKVKDLIGKIIKVEEKTDTLKKKWEDELLPELKTALRKGGYKFKTVVGSGEEGGIKAFNLMKFDGTIIKIGEMNKDFFSNEDNKSEIIHLVNSVEEALEGKDPWKKNSDFKNFIDINKHLFKDIDGKGDSSTDDDMDKRKKKIKISLGGIQSAFYENGGVVDDELLRKDQFKNNFKILFKALVKNKDSIEEENNILKSEDFEKLVKSYDDDFINNTSQISDFLRLCKEKYDEFENARLTVDSFNKFQSLLTSIVPLDFLLES